MYSEARADIIASRVSSMSSRLAFAVSITLCFAVTPAYAGQDEQDEQQSPADPAVEAPEKEDVICKREAKMGSKVTPKVCRTPSEWKAIRTRDRENFKNRERD